MFFDTALAFGDWLARHGAGTRALLVGFHKVGSGLPSMTWPQSVDEALCHGWIDGVRQRVDELRYTIRFTPRQTGSHWSAVNVARMAELTAQGRVQPAGAAAFARRTEARTAQAAYEQPGEPELPAWARQRLKAEPAAWRFFQAQAPSWRKTVIWRLISAKQPATQQRRLQAMIDAALQGQRW